MDRDETPGNSRNKWTPKRPCPRAAPNGGRRTRRRNSNSSTSSSTSGWARWRPSCRKRSAQQNTEIVKLNKLVATFQGAERQFQETNEAAIAKAKDTYRKYEAYLENAEDAVVFAWTFALGTLDLIDHVFESLIRESETDLAVFFRRDLSEEADAKRKAAIDKLSKSEFLRKRKLFLDIGRLASLRDELDFKEKQAKFDRLAELIAQGTAAKTAPIIRVLPAQELASMNSGSAQAENREGPSKSVRGTGEDFVASNLALLTQNIIAAKQMVESHPHANVDHDILRELIARTNDFLLALQSQFFSFQGTGEGEEGGRDGGEAPLFSAETLEKALARIGALEKAEIERLVEVRARNDRLRAMQAHLKQ